MQTETEDLKIYVPLAVEDDIQALALNVTTYNPGSLRYQIFDLATLLLGEGIPSKVFKGELSFWLYDAQRELRAFSSGSEASRTRDPINDYNLSNQLRGYFEQIEYWVDHLGRAVFTGDRLHYYRVRCHSILFETQAGFARDLRGGGQTSGSGRWPLGRRFVWENHCLISGELAYRFSNQEDPYPVKGAYGVTRIE